MKKIRNILLIITLLTSNIYAQNIQRLDSLFNEKLYDQYLEEYIISNNKIKLLHDSIKLYIYDKIAYCYTRKSNFAKKIEYHLKTYQSLKNINDINGATHTLLKIASTYSNLNDKKQSYYYYNEVYKNIHDVQELYYYLIASEHINNKKYNDAYINIINGLNINNNSLNLNYRLGDYYIIIKNYNDAIKQYKLTLELLPYDTVEYFKDNIKNKCYSQLATIYIEQNNIQHARYYLELMDNSLLNIEDKYQTYLLLYKKINNADSVYFYSEKLIAIKDSLDKLNKSELSENLNAEFNAKFNVDKYQHQIELKNKQRIVLFIIIGVCILIIILSFGSFLWIKKQKIIKEKLLHIVKDKNKEVTDSINYAQGIQQSILPLNTNNNCFILFKPKDIVSGDFYWLFEKNNKQYYAVVDCTGHGVPGALLSMLCSQLLTQSISKYSNVKSIVEYVKNELQERMEKLNRNDSFEIGLLMIENQNIEYYGIKRPLFILHKNNNLETCKPENDIIKLSLKKDTMLYITTDGYIDQFGGNNNKKYGSKNFREFLLNLNNKSITEQEQLLNDNIISWQGNNEQVDDILVLGLKIK
mgnify:CR=1 FL=1